MPPKTEAQFPLWTAMDSLCRRYSVELASPVSDVILHPNSFSSAKDLGPIAPIVSIAIGQNQWVDGRSRYFSSFQSSTMAASSPWLCKIIINKK